MPHKDMERRREYEKQYHREHYKTKPLVQRKLANLWHYHRMRAGDWLKLWRDQEGCCYLCGNPMDPLKAVVEHDHSCCGQHFSCAECRRGLACRRCNLILGWAEDDPALLRGIADVLEAKKK
jgi:Recombination endonuclease VII